MLDEDKLNETQYFIGEHYSKLSSHVILALLLRVYS